ncbi:MAG: hypothetical protein L3J91_05780, partial [Thermoplasmata archaeon]|nr:hypothetical protein [Thermoplasmata archaeon]
GVPSGCAPAGTGSLQCTPTVPGTYSVGVVATDNLGFTAGGRTTLLVNADPTIGSFSAGVPNVTVNQPVTLHVVTSGGTAPLTYAYFGLPPGCVGANASSLACTPTVVGNYSIDATVSDSVGMSASVLLTLAVDPLPFIRTPGGGTGSHLGGSSNSSTSTTNVFYAGVALGLVALVVAIVALLRRARETREGRELVEELRRSPVPEPAPETSEAVPPRFPPS